MRSLFTLPNCKASVDLRVVGLVEQLAPCIGSAWYASRRSHGEPQKPNTAPVRGQQMLFTDHIPGGGGVGS